MTLSQYTGTELPDGSTTDDVPAVIQRIFDNIDSKFVLFATSTADRDTKYADAPKGTYVVCPALRTAWCKLYDHVADVPSGASLWWTLGQDMADNTTAFSFTNSNWQGNGSPASHLKIRNGYADFSLRLGYIGTADITPFNSYTGDCANQTIGQLSNVYAPVDLAGFSCSYAGGWASFGIDSTGVVSLGATQVGGGVHTNDGFAIQAVWALAVY